MARQTREVTPLGAGTGPVDDVSDAASRRTSATLPNAVSIDYGYDNANQLTAITHKRSGATLQALAYTFDAAGRRISLSGSAARINLLPALSSATYDANNRLTDWAGTPQGYDFNGNLTSNGVQGYTWGTRDRHAPRRLPRSAQPLGHHHHQHAPERLGPPLADRMLARRQPLPNGMRHATPPPP